MSSTDASENRFLTLLSNMRMCANVPAQHAIQTALGGYQSVNELIGPGGRFREQSKLAWRLLNDIPGVSCVEPRGALYCFPRLDPDVYDIKDDEQFVIDLKAGEGRGALLLFGFLAHGSEDIGDHQIGRASCRERV